MDPAPDKPGKSRGPGVRLQCMVPQKVVDQVNELAEVLQISRPSVVSLAITRMYRGEPLLKANGKKEK